MNKKVLCIGHATYDISIVMDDYPKENIKYRVNEKIECGGGPASNAAYLLGKWGLDTHFMGSVGADFYGYKIKQEFDKIGVDTKYMEFCKTGETTSSFVIINSKNASRTIFAYRDTNLKLKNDKVNIKPDYILVDGQELEASLKIIEENPNAITILDAGNRKEENVLLGQKVDYLVTSRNFAEDFTQTKIDLKDSKSIVQVFKTLESSFKGKIVITLEGNGALYKNNKEIKLMPGYKVKAKDTTGAGDIFHGAFVYALSQGYCYEDVIRISNIAGALSVTKIGGRYSVPDLEEVLKIYENTK